MKRKSLNAAPIFLCALYFGASAASADTIDPGTFNFGYFGTATGILPLDSGSVTTGTTTGAITLLDNFTNIGSGPSSFEATNFITFNSAPVDYKVTKTVTNDTTFVWTDFLVSWGCPTTTQCGSQPLLSNDFSSPGCTVSSVSCGGTLTTDNAVEILWDNLNVHPGQSVVLTFGLIAQGCPSVCVESIYQQPSIDSNSTASPEPESLFLGGLGLALTCAARFRKRRA